MTDEPSGRNLDGDAPVVEAVVETDEATIAGDAELERTIGLGGGLAIGIGTMIGAGIFVFPGLAGGEIGTAATASFAVGGVIALLVALPTSELATAMPRSGGGYYFISRGLGTLAGTAAEDGDAGTPAGTGDAAAERLRETGLDVETALAAADSPFDALIDAVPGRDAVVMGERAPSFRSLVFGDESERVAAASVGPVLVVRDRPESGEGDAEATSPGDEE